MWSEEGQDALVAKFTRGENTSAGWNWYDPQNPEWVVVAWALAGKRGDVAQATEKDVEQAQQMARAACFTSLFTAAGLYLVHTEPEGRLGFDAERRQRLLRLHDLAAEMEALIFEDRHWLEHSLCKAGSVADARFFEPSFDEWPPNGVLRGFQLAISEYVEQNKVRGGNPGKRARRRFWIAAALVYEAATAKKVATSTTITPTGQTKPCGPFVRYIVALSSGLMPAPSPDMIDDFVRWYKLAKGGKPP